jgi:formate-dependent nitrite reductase cytochrome c552 subunit
MLVMLQRLRRASAVAVLLFVPLGLAACGESSEEKADKQVCSGVSEIQTQIKKLETLPISASFPTEAKASVEAIDKSVSKIKEAAPKISSARKEEIESANKAFQTEIASITASVVSATKSSNLEAALKGAEPRIKAALSTLSSDYKKAFEALKC